MATRLVWNESASELEKLNLFELCYGVIETLGIDAPRHGLQLTNVEMGRLSRAESIICKMPGHLLNRMMQASVEARELRKLNVSQARSLKEARQMVRNNRKAAQEAAKRVSTLTPQDRHRGGQTTQQQAIQRRDQVSKIWKDVKGMKLSIAARKMMAKMTDQRSEVWKGQSLRNMETVIKELDKEENYTRPGSRTAKRL